MEQFVKNPSHGDGRPSLELMINGVKFDWKEQYISGAEVKKLAKIPKEDRLFLDIEKPWEDEIVKDETMIDLARPGIEQFVSQKNQNPRLVEIEINRKSYQISRGKHAVVEIKRLGGVPEAHELEELINGKLTPLDDNSYVLIKGCEKFFSHPRDGSSS